ncbi:MAG: hypothetical protein L0Y32_05835 [Nevskiales bacterium]|nr:hypothetical protein [Nevskiales bacterium]
MNSLNSLLVLNPGPIVCPRWLQMAFPGSEFHTDPESQCSAILVINDHSASVLPLLQKALELRHERQLVMVVTPLEDDESGLTALVNGVAGLGPERALSEKQLTTALELERLPFRTHLSLEAINFEYEA